MVNSEIYWDYRIIDYEVSDMKDFREFIISKRTFSAAVFAFIDSSLVYLGLTQK